MSELEFLGWLLLASVGAEGAYVGWSSLRRRQRHRHRRHRHHHDRR
jgi:hypothetical protein